MKTEEKQQEDVVTVKKSALDAMISRLERLEASASKAALAHFDGKEPEKRRETCRLRTIDGKVVVGWDRMVENATEKNEHGVWFEKQTVKVRFEDGTEETMPYVFFARRHNFIECEITGERICKSKEDVARYGAKTLDLKAADAEYKDIGILFVN